MTIAVDLGCKASKQTKTIPKCWYFTLQAGYIYCKPFPQLCLAVSETRIETTLTGKDQKLVGFVATMQKRMVGNPHQMWEFREDASIASRVSTVKPV